MIQTPEQAEAENRYRGSIAQDLGLPWSVHLEHFGGDHEPSMHPHPEGGERLGYNRQVIWCVKNSEGKEVHVSWVLGPQLIKLHDAHNSPLMMTESVVYEECHAEHPDPEGSRVRAHLQRAVDAMNALVEEA